MPDDVQPEPGQGTEATGGLYDSYLQTVPDEARPAAEQWFRDTSKGLDAKLQEAAELKKTWEPYQDVRDSLAAYDPQDLQQLIAWHQQVTSSDEAYRTWLQESAKEAGLTVAEEETLAAAEEAGELSRDEVQRLIQEATAERLAPVEQQLSVQESERLTTIEESAINTEFGRISQEIGHELSKDEKAAIVALGMDLAVDAKGEALPMGDASWVQKGFDRYKQITDAGNRTFVEQKMQQPGQSLSAGGTPALKPITSFQDANAAMRERLRQAT